MPYWIHSDPEGRHASQDTAKRCCRGDRCTSGQPVTGDDGEPGYAAGWADLPSPFCRRDHRHVMFALVALPARYADLRRLLGDKPTGHGDKITMSRTPPTPLRLDFDALMYDMTAVLTSWEARVADDAQLAYDPAMAARRRHQFAVGAAVKVLEAHFDRLLALDSGPMTRMVPLTAQMTLPATVTGGQVYPYAGFAEVDLMLDGAAAGRELLALNQRGRSLLGETIPARDRLTGVPCKHCDALTLEDALPEYKSHCTECGHLLTPGEYRDHVARWAAWARAQQSAALLEAS